MTHLYIHRGKKLWAHTGTLNVRVCALFSADMREGRQGYRPGLRRQSHTKYGQGDVFILWFSV
jgi:hypothetical protein